MRVAIISETPLYSIEFIDKLEQAISRYLQNDKLDFEVKLLAARLNSIIDDFLKNPEDVRSILNKTLAHYMLYKDVCQEKKGLQIIDRCEFGLEMLIDSYKFDEFIPPNFKDKPLDASVDLWILVSSPEKKELEKHLGPAYNNYKIFSMYHGYHFWRNAIMLPNNGSKTMVIVNAEKLDFDSLLQELFKLALAKNKIEC